MKKLFLIFILSICLIMPASLMSGCGKKPINVSGKTFAFSSVDISWKKGSTGEEKSSILQKYNKGTERELFAELENTYTHEYQQTIITFFTNGTFEFTNGIFELSPITGTYMQDGKKLSLTIDGQIGQATVNGDNVEIFETTTSDSEVLDIKIIYKKSSNSTPSSPQISSVKGKTFTVESITTNWVVGTTNAQKQAILTETWCETEQELFEMLETGYDTLTLVFDNTINCTYSSTGGSFNISLDLTFTETNTSINLYLFGSLFGTFTKSGNKLTDTQQLEDYPCIEQTIILTPN